MNNVLYVGSLSYSLEEEDLKEAFKKFGAIKEVKIFTDEDGDSKGYAFVIFEKEEDARKALNLNGKSLHGRRIKVNLKKTRAQMKKSFINKF